MTNLFYKFFTDFPLTKKFRSTNLFNAFILNSIVAAVTSALLVELRLQLQDNKKSILKNFITSTFKVDNLLDYQKVIAVFITGIFVSFMVYNIMYYFVSFGGGMMTNKVDSGKYW
jgi:hypothetical protein